MLCVIATLGFDADFVIRRLSSEPKPLKLVCVGLRADEYGWRRVEQTFKLVSFYCQPAGVSCLLESVGAKSCVRELRSIMERELRSGCSAIELYLTGGPRISVVAAVLASMILPRSLEENVRIVVEGEAFDARLEVPVGAYRKISQLNDIERRILLEASRGPVRPTELARALGLYKPVAYRRVRGLLKAGLLERVGGNREEYVASNLVRRVFELVDPGQPAP